MKTTTITIITLLLSLTSVFGQHQKDNIIAFIGEKIEVKYFPEEKELEVQRIINGKDTSYGILRSMDNRYIAKYKVLKLINGSYKQDTVEFLVFDHYGDPTFSNYKNVLLFVSYFKGKLYHKKYQYFDMYLTTDNRWASPYPSRENINPFKNDIKIVPEKISFKEQISFSIKNMSSEQIQTRFPKPYYEIKNDKAIAVYGYYVRDLLKLRQQAISKTSTSTF